MGDKIFDRIDWTEVLAPQRRAGWREATVDGSAPTQNLVTGA
jgi:hypothetical protein